MVRIRHTYRCGLAALAAVVAVAGCGGSDYPAQATYQESLRLLVSDAPSGKHGYWLGPAFKSGHISYVNPAWRPFAAVKYRRTRGDSTALAVEIRTFKTLEDAKRDGAAAQVLMGRLPVRLYFLEPANPSRQLIREAIRALAPVPRGVTYSGTQGDAG
jgi:hypothetical protein